MRRLAKRCSCRPRFDQLEGVSADLAVIRPFIGHALVKLKSAALIKWLSALTMGIFDCSEIYEKTSKNL